MRVVFNIQLPVQFKTRKKWVVAGCPVLDVWTQGPTLEEAKKNIVEALELFLLTCYEAGTLEQVLKDSGFTPLSPAARLKPPRLRTSPETVTVPLTFAVSPRAAECPA